MKRLFLLLSFFVLYSLISTVDAQFYNGLEMDFGKNRVQYNDFYWSYYRYERYDVYFNQDGKTLAQYVSDYAEKRIPEIEAYFDYTIDNRIIFLVYNKLTDFRQSNIGLVSADEEENLGGMTNILDNKIFVYFNGDHEDLHRQISAAIAEVILNEMLYGSEFKDNMANSTLLNLPRWFVPGLISYISRDWDYEIENRVKDGILNGKYEKFNRLSDENAKYAGHSFWKYIAETYGESVIPNIIYLTRVNKNANNGFLYVLGQSLKDLSYEWVGYYTNIFEKYENLEQADNTEPVFRKPKPKRVYNQVKLNPRKDKMAYVVNEMGQYKIFIYDFETDKKKRILKREHKIEQIVDYSYPVMAWHPSGRILTFFIEEEGRVSLYYYTLETEELESRNFLYFDKILDYSFSNDGSQLVMSAVKNGQTDIFVHTLSSSTNEQITNDISDDFNPRFINNSKQIIFSSTRENDSVFVNKEDAGKDKTGLTKRLYIYDYATRSVQLKKIETEPYSNSIEPFEVDKNRFVFLNDNNGIWNRNYATFDSTISHIDTITHYRYISATKQITNYPQSILEQDVNSLSDEAGEIVFKNKRFFIRKKKIDKQASYSEDELLVSDYSSKYKEKLKVQDSLRKIEKKVIPIQDIQNNQIIIDEEDTLELDVFSIDINNYVFEKEKINYYNNKYKDKNINLTYDTTTVKEPKIRIYQTAFYTNYMVTQADFSFLGQFYQPFTSGSDYYNPRLNSFFKVGTNDLFEDYRLIGGINLSLNLNSNEYLLSLENLKYRTDKQYLFYRQVFESVLDTTPDNPNYPNDSKLIKTVSSNFSYILKYPFNQVFAVRFTSTLRQDKVVFLAQAYDDDALQKDDVSKLWTGIKGELIFDNTRNLGVNLYTGSRFKIFAEGYKQLNRKKSDLFVLGADFRNYLRIHRDFIWANRFAASTSFGNSRLIYYLGAVDNWRNFKPGLSTFNRSIPIDYTKNYSYQTIATNLRGFEQNIRNGCNFAVVNSELRLPIIRYLLNYPISSNFWNNLQIVGFFDIGSAWTGLNPYSNENAWDKKEYVKQAIKVTIDSGRGPFVAGYGAGLRLMLMGYFIRLDYAWGIENETILPRIFYFSLNLDF